MWHVIMIIILITIIIQLPLLHENMETLFSDLHTNYQHKKNSWLHHPRIKLSRKKE